MNALTSYNKGRFAELYACAYLFLKGYVPLERRYKTPVGEIDIIARRGSNIVFFEVKYRESQGAAGESITALAKTRISRAAEYYMAAQARKHEASAKKLSEIASGYRSYNQSVQIDAVVIDRYFRIKHIKNAW